jgi:hypothetical protein
VQLESPWWRSHGGKSQDVRCQRLKRRFTDVSPCLHSSRPTSLARPPPTRPVSRAPVLLNVHALPAGFTTCAREPLRTRKPPRLCYLRGRLRCIRAAPASLRRRGACIQTLPARGVCAVRITCKHWLWTRTAGTREDMGPRLPEAALPTCKAHGALGEQALSPVAVTHHTVSSSNATLHAEECESVLCPRLSSTLSSVQSTSLHSHFYTVSRIRTPQNQKSLRLPLRPAAPTPLPPRARANPPSTNGQREGPPTAPRRAKRRPLIPVRRRRAGRARRRARARRTRLRIRVRRPLGSVIRRIARRMCPCRPCVSSEPRRQSTATVSSARGI